MAMEVFRLVGRIVYEGAQDVTRGLNGLSGQLQGAQAKMQAFGAKAQEVGQKTTAVGQGFTKYVTAPLIAVGAAGVLAADDTQKAMGRIQASTGATKKASEQLAAAAVDLWKNKFSGSVVEAADSISKVKQNLAGMAKDSEIPGLTKQALTLEETFNYDVAESTRAVSQLMKHFGVDGQGAFDRITVAAQKGGDYSGELLDTISEYSTQFSSAGISIDTMFNTLLAGAEAGAWNMDKVGDAVKEFNIRAKDGSKATAEGFAAIGMNAEEMGAKIAAGGKEGESAYMATLTALAAMEDPVKRNAAGVALFGTQWEDLESKTMAAMSTAGNELGNFQGATERAGAALHDNFGDRLVIAWRNLQAALIPVGNVLMTVLEPALAKVNQVIQNLANWFGSLSAENQKFIVILSLVAAAIGPILIVVGTLVASIGAIATAIGTVSLVAVGWIAAIVAIGAAIVALYLKFEPFRTVVNTIFTAVLNTIQTILTAVVTFVQSQLARLQQFWQENGTQIMQAVTNAFNGIKAIIDFIMPAVLAVIQFIWGSVKSVITGALDIIMGAIKIFSGLFTGDWSKMWEGVKQLLGGAVDFVLGLMNLSFFGGIKKILLNLSKSAISTIKTMASSVVNWFKNLGSNAGAAVSGMVSKVISFFTNLWNRARSIFQTLRTFGESVFSSLRNTITNVASGIYNGFVNKISSMASTVKSRFSSILSSAKSIFNNIKTAITNPIETAKNTLTKVIDSIKNAFKNMKVKIPMPHFNFSSGTKSVAGIEIPYPKVSVDWYKDGSVFGAPSIIGVGEEPGVKEAVIPLKPSVLAGIGQGIQQATETTRAAAAASGSSGKNTPVYNHVHVYIGEEEIINYIEPGISQKQGDGASRKSRFEGGKA